MSKFDWKKLEEEGWMKTNGGNQATGIMSSENCDKVVEKVKTALTLGSSEAAMAMIAGLCQRGGTNKNISGQVAYQVNNKTLTAQAFSKICQEEGKGTPRQFARAMAQDIYEVASLLGEEGDLTRQMRMEYPNMTIEETIWCSNFQGMNPNCPETVRNWLAMDQRRRFGR